MVMANLMPQTDMARTLVVLTLAYAQTIFFGTTDADVCHETALAISI